MHRGVHHQICVGDGCTVGVHHQVCVGDGCTVGVHDRDRSRGRVHHRDAPTNLCGRRVHRRFMGDWWRGECRIQADSQVRSGRTSGEGAVLCVLYIYINRFLRLQNGKKMCLTNACDVMVALVSTLCQNL